MKSMIVMLHLALPLILNAAGPSAEELALAKARNNGAQAKECLRVVDQDGMPVADARIWGGLQTGDGYKDFIPIRGSTDTNGEYIVQGKCTSRVRCGIFKEGYYASEFLVKYPDGKVEKRVENGKWQPYGAVANITLQPFAVRSTNRQMDIPS